MVKVQWLDQAREHVYAIYTYYCRHASLRVATNLKNEILSSTKQLTLFPHSGSPEPLAEGLDKEYRFVLVRRTWKIIYYIEDNQCLISCVWDTRNNPELLPKILLGEA